MTTKHTPEPWRVNPGTGEIRAADWNVIIADTHQSDADAHLIAAAPDLLAACEDALSAMDAIDVGTSRTSDMLRAAIAKANGGEP